MYDRTKKVSIPSTISAQPNNLSCLLMGDQLFATTIHKSNLFITNLSSNITRPIKLQPIIKGKGFPITQARWIRNPSGRHILVLTGEGGVMLYDWDGGVLLRAFEVISKYEQQKEVTTRGITGICGSIAIGCSTGEVLIVSSGVDGNYLFYDADEDCQEITYGTEFLRIRWTEHEVETLASAGDSLAVGDRRGNICLGKLINGTLQKTWIIESFGSCLTSLVCSKGSLFASYISGHIKMFNLERQKLSAEICAHARPISALDSVSLDSEEETRLVSAGEDSFVRVWTVTGKKISHLHSQSLENKLLMGVAFTDDKGNGYVTAAYDATELELHLSD